jgi:hypothetical protein
VPEHVRQAREARPREVGAPFRQHARELLGKHGRMAAPDEQVDGGVGPARQVLLQERGLTDPPPSGHHCEAAVPLQRRRRRAIERRQFGFAVVEAHGSLRV